MTSTELKIGLNTSTRPSSRVLKPPGGGHTNIFSEPDVSVNAPRPKHNQQNSSNLNACMNSTDPNNVVEKLREEISHPKEEPKASTTTTATITNKKDDGGNKTASSSSSNVNEPARGRIPPGGYSSGGFW